MTRRTEISWLKDISLSIEKIEQHPQYKNGRQGYDADEYFRGWVYLHVERICEAATHLCNQYRYDEKHPELPWRGIVGTRIVLAHCYWNYVIHAFEKKTAQTPHQDIITARRNYARIENERKKKIQK